MQNYFFDYLQINLASPSIIKSWGGRLQNSIIEGEVYNPATFYNSNLLPVKNGLYCDKIFGPLKSWECYCGRYTGKLLYKYKIPLPYTCEYCNVEITDSIIRRYRMGYIDLMAPVIHNWFLNFTPSYLSILLFLPTNLINNILNFSHKIRNRLDSRFKGDLKFNDDDLDDYFSNPFSFLITIFNSLDILADFELDDLKSEPDLFEDFISDFSEDDYIIDYNKGYNFYCIKQQENYENFFFSNELTNIHFFEKNIEKYEDFEEYAKEEYFEEYEEEEAEYFEEYEEEDIENIDLIHIPSFTKFNLFNKFTKLYLLTRKNFYKNIEYNYNKNDIDLQYLNEYIKKIFINKEYFNSNIYYDNLGNKNYYLDDYAKLYNDDDDEKFLPEYFEIEHIVKYYFLISVIFSEIKYDKIDAFLWYYIQYSISVQRKYLSELSINLNFNIKTFIKQQYILLKKNKQQNYEKFIIKKNDHKLSFKYNYLFIINLINNNKFLSCLPEIFYTSGCDFLKIVLENYNLKQEIYSTVIDIQFLNLINQFFNIFEIDEDLLLLKKKLLQRLRILQNFLNTNSKPSWMVLSVIPVLPATLRPMFQLEGGHYLNADITSKYLDIVSCNLKLVAFLKMDLPEQFINECKRNLQFYVNDLFDNTDEDNENDKNSSSAISDKKEIRSLYDLISGKFGRFRYNLLGKRVNFSGRSIIVIDPQLAIHQCGLPYELILELFYFNIVTELLKNSYSISINDFEMLISLGYYKGWEFLSLFLQRFIVLLNRAPTLHRLGIQAFEPILILEKVIKLHPFVCTAFNADFDGDQMAVHLPLSFRSQLEAKLLMFSKFNFLSPATSEPVLLPSQDVVLGCYYLTLNNINISFFNKNNINYYYNENDAISAYNSQIINLHDNIFVKIQLNKQFIKTTVGRLIFNKLLQDFN